MVFFFLPSADLGLGKGSHQHLCQLNTDPPVSDSTPSPSPAKGQQLDKQATVSTCPLYQYIVSTHKVSGTVLGSRVSELRDGTGVLGRPPRRVLVLLPGPAPGLPAGASGLPQRSTGCPGAKGAWDRRLW